MFIIPVLLAWLKSFYDGGQASAQTETGQDRQMTCVNRKADEDQVGMIPQVIQMFLNTG